MELIVDHDEGLHRVAVVVLEELKLLVVEGLGIGVTPRSLASQNADVDGERFVIVLHEFRKIEKLTEKIRRHIFGLDCVLDIRDQLLLFAC